MEHNTTPSNFDDFVKGVKTSETILKSEKLNAAADWHYENEQDQELEILTSFNEQKRKIKKFTVNGQEVVVKTLAGKDSAKIMRMAGLGSKGADKDAASGNYILAMIVAATTVAGSLQTMEFFEELDMPAYNRIMGVVTSLNF